MALKHYGKKTTSCFLFSVIELLPSCLSSEFSHFLPSFGGLALIKLPPKKLNIVPPAKIFFTRLLNSLLPIKSSLKMMHTPILNIFYVKINNKVF